MSVSSVQVMTESVVVVVSRLVAARHHGIVPGIIKVKMEVKVIACVGSGSWKQSEQVSQ
jgi:hypothetical protein